MQKVISWFIQRKNTKLLHNFKSHARKLEEQNNQVIKELSEYEKMLGWNYSNRGGNKQQTAGNFYLTHWLYQWC